VYNTGVKHLPLKLGIFVILLFANEIIFFFGFRVPMAEEKTA
jgi:hypothetical protein